MNQEQIEAVRARAITVRYSVITFAGHVQHKLHDEIADDLGALIKANEELRAEAETMCQMRETAQELGYEDVLDALEANDDLRVTIDRLTKERDGAWKSADRSQSELTDAIDDLDEARTRLSAMQEAIDEAVRRADTETPFKTHVIVSDVVEPLRPFATKPEPEVDPLEGHTLGSVMLACAFDAHGVAVLERAIAARGGRVVFDGRKG